MRRLVVNGGKYTLHQAARALCLHGGVLQPDIIASLLNALLSVEPSNKGTMKELDLGLIKLLENGHGEAAISYVTQLLSSPDGSIELSEFGAFTSTLLSGSKKQFNRVLVNWLLGCSLRLCHGLANALQGHNFGGPPLDLLAEDLAISPATQVFLCRKAIGWFFFKPTTAASVLVSVLRFCEPKTAFDVQNLLIESLY